MKLLCTLLGATAVVAYSPINTRQDDGLAGQAPNFGYQELLNLQCGFWDKFKYPSNLKEAQAINSTVFSEDVQGRVSDTRNFVGRELNTEYIFGLFIPSESVSIIGQPGDWEILQFVAIQNIASATTRVNFTFPVFNNITLPVTIDTWITWNSNREISQYDATFRWFGFLIKTLMSFGNGTDEEKGKVMVDRIAKSICHSHASYCKGSNVQYKDDTECYDFLTKDIRVGQSFELGMNTLLCRNVHEIMVKYRPDVHCSHIGKSGGGMCDDKTSYVSKVSEDYFTNSPWIPTVF